MDLFKMRAVASPQPLPEANPLAASQPSAVAATGPPLYGADIQSLLGLTQHPLGGDPFTPLIGIEWDLPDETVPNNKSSCVGAAFDWWIINHRYHRWSMMKLTNDDHTELQTAPHTVAEWVEVRQLLSRYCTQHGIGTVDPSQVEANRFARTAPHDLIGEPSISRFGLHLHLDIHSAFRNLHDAHNFIVAYLNILPILTRVCRGNERDYCNQSPDYFCTFPS
jgi:hypothetical protein